MIKVRYNTDGNIRVPGSTSTIKPSRLRKCNLYGCNLTDQIDYGDAITQICKDCDKKYIYNKKGGDYDKRLYNYCNRRSTIQPWWKKAWDECYGRTKYGRINEGVVEDEEDLTYEEEKQMKEDGLFLKKQEDERVGLETELINQEQTSYKDKNPVKMTMNSGFTSKI